MQQTNQYQLRLQSQVQLILSQSTSMLMFSAQTSPKNASPSILEFVQVRSV